MQQLLSPERMRLPHSRRAPPAVQVGKDARQSGRKSDVRTTPSHAPASSAAAASHRVINLVNVSGCHAADVAAAPAARSAVALVRCARADADDGGSTMRVRSRHREPLRPRRPTERGRRKDDAPSPRLTRVAVVLRPVQLNGPCPLPCACLQQIRRNPDICAHACSSRHAAWATVDICTTRQRRQALATGEAEECAPSQLRTAAIRSRSLAGSGWRQPSTAASR